MVRRQALADRRHQRCEPPLSWEGEIPLARTAMRPRHVPPFALRAYQGLPLASPNCQGHLNPVVRSKMSSCTRLNLDRRAVTCRLLDRSAWELTCMDPEQRPADFGPSRSLLRSRPTMPQGRRAGSVESELMPSPRPTAARTRPCRARSACRGVRIRPKIKGTRPAIGAVRMPIEDRMAKSRQSGRSPRVQEDPGTG